MDKIRLIKNHSANLSEMVDDFMELKDAFDYPAMLDAQIVTIINALNCLKNIPECSSAITSCIEILSSITIQRDESREHPDIKRAVFSMLVNQAGVISNVATNMSVLSKRRQDLLKATAEGVTELKFGNYTAVGHLERILQRQQSNSRTQPD